jgi:predicted nuclease of predicted toxin-antitoxin system
MILADENIDPRFITAIRSIPIDVFSIQEHYRGISDEEILEISKNPPRIILTEDKDFGEWVFAHHISEVSVIFLRYDTPDIEKIISEVVSLLRRDKENLFGKFTTVTSRKIRTRLI